MRKVDRNSVAKPASLGRGGEAADERARARAHYRRSSNRLPGPSRQSFDFAAYKLPDVVLQLELLFHGKCAYCEFRYKGGDSVRVEHYRPKGGVAEDTNHPGYWWLASEWTNLLPACEHCNSWRYHSSGWDAQGVPHGRLRYGKKNAFPIQGAARATRASDDHALEDPLLIDPTRQDPADHLAWTTVGGSSVVVAKWQGGRARLDPYAETTIQTLGLNRQSLVEDRTELMNDLREIGNRLETHIDRALNRTGDALSDALDDIKCDLESLEERCAPERRFSAMARHFVDTLIASLRARLQALPTYP